MGFIYLCIQETTSWVPSPCRHCVRPWRWPQRRTKRHSLCPQKPQPFESIRHLFWFILLFWLNRCLEISLSYCFPFFFFFILFKDVWVLHVDGIHQQNESEKILTDFIGSSIQIICVCSMYHFLYPGKVLGKLIMAISRLCGHGWAAHQNTKLRLGVAPPFSVKLAPGDGYVYSGGLRGLS